MTELEDLRYHWDEAYEINEAAGVFEAKRIGAVPAVVLRDTDPERLRTAIRRDYTARRRPADRMST